MKKHLKALAPHQSSKKFFQVAWAQLEGKSLLQNFYHEKLKNLLFFGVVVERELISPEQLEHWGQLNQYYHNQ